MQTGPGSKKDIDPESKDSGSGFMMKFEMKFEFDIDIDIDFFFSFETRLKTEQNLDPIRRPSKQSGRPRTARRAGNCDQDGEGSPCKEM